MVRINKVAKAEEFNPKNVLNDIKINPDHITRRNVNRIMHYPDPIAPPANMKLFSHRIEEVNDMRHFLHNKYTEPVSIIHIEPECDYLYNHFDENQMRLYHSDYVSDGFFPHDPGLFYAENNNDGTHDWKSVPNAIMNCLSELLYWMKFTELTGIDPADYFCGLDGADKRLYEIIQDHKDELLEMVEMITF